MEERVFITGHLDTCWGIDTCPLRACVCASPGSLECLGHVNDESQRSFGSSLDEGVLGNDSVGLWTPASGKGVALVCGVQVLARRVLIPE